MNVTSPEPTVSSSVGFAASEIDTSAATRTARLKWVIVVNESLPAGVAANAAACIAAATARNVEGLLGGDATDACGHVHPGLPWAGCTIVKADGATLRTIRAQAGAHGQTFVADMPAAAQLTRVYDDYLTTLSRQESDAINYHAVGLIGPRKRVDKIVGRLPLL